jgi:hypothetical protein
MARPVAITSHLAPVPPGFKPHWRDILEENVAIYRRLPEDLTLAVEELIPWFIEKVEWEWSHWVGPKPDKELQQVCVACEACLLIARRSKEDYAHFKKFIFFPTDLEPLEIENAAGDASSSSGRIRQGWYWTKHGMEDGVDNYNLTLHEFAHMLDFREGNSTSVPYFDDATVQRNYELFLEKEYGDICRAWEKKSGCIVIEKYATKKVEFFTVSTEAFFEYADMLQVKRRTLYNWMKEIYGMDPVQWPERVSYPDLQRERYEGLPNWQTRSSWKSEKAKLPEWPEGLSAAEYDIEKERKSHYQKERERIEKFHEEKLRREKIRLERAERQAEEKAQKTRERKARKDRLRLERMERKARERQLTNNRTVVIKYPGGKPQLKYRLVDGQREGLLQRWDKEGRLREETELHRGQKQGKVMYYHPNGQIEIEGFHSLNERAGVWLGWHEDGTPSFRSEYREGQLHKWAQLGSGENLRTFGKVKNRFGL